MAKLATIKPILGFIKPRLGRSVGDEQAHDRYRSTAKPWRKWYWTTRWRKIRLEIFLRDMYTCRMCGKVESDTANLVADHIEPHNGDPIMFWLQSNIQCICAPCHNSEKQKAEKRRSFYSK